MLTHIEAIRNEMDIARQALAEAGLVGYLSDEADLCEVYHRPAHNNGNTIFARLCVSARGLYAIYAKAVIFTLGWKLTKESFETTKVANLHGGSEGHIVCGIRYLDAFDEKDIRQALREVASLSVSEKQGFTLDDEDYFVSSPEGQSLFMRSYADLSFDGVESVHLLMRIIDVVSGNER